MARTENEVTDAELRLLLAPGIGPITCRKLRERFGDADAIVGASVSALTSIDGIGREMAEALRRAMDDADVSAEREEMVKHDVRLILRDDASYPALLAAIDDAPPALWVRGELREQDRLSIAIVGSRRCSPYGREQAGRFAALLAQAGLAIVSGGALGIDGEAHRGALRVKGRTIAVMGCGLSRLYPPEHESLFERIAAEGGALVSEFPMRIGPLAQNFPRRNRIISGLSVGVLVIEAAMRSGALITARLAAEEHGREVMAVPGRVDSPASAGCLKLIRDGAAALARDHADVLSQLDASSQLVRGALEAAGHDGAAKAATLFDGNLSPGQRAIVDVLTDGETMLVDQIAARTQLPMSQLMADLTLLEIRGRVQRERGGVRLRQR
jgi:DNA processing protein